MIIKTSNTNFIRLCNIDKFTEMHNHNEPHAWQFKPVYDAYDYAYELIWTKETFEFPDCPPEWDGLPSFCRIVSDDFYEINFDDYVITPDGYSLLIFPYNNHPALPNVMVQSLECDWYPQKFKLLFKRGTDCTFYKDEPFAKCTPVPRRE